MLSSILINLKLVPLAHAVTEIELIAPFPGSGTSTTSVSQYVGNLYLFAIGLGALLAMAVIIWGGIRYMAETDKAFMKSEAKAWIFSGVLGLLILLGATLILNTLNADLTTLRDPSQIVDEINAKTAERARLRKEAADAAAAALSKAAKLEIELEKALKPWTDFIDRVWTDPDFFDWLFDIDVVGTAIDEFTPNSYRLKKHKEAEKTMASVILNIEDTYKNKSWEDACAFAEARNNYFIKNSRTQLSEELGGVYGTVRDAYIRERVKNNTRKNWVDERDKFPLDNDGTTAGFHMSANDFARKETKKKVLKEIDLVDTYAQTMADKLWEIRNRETIGDPDSVYFASEGRRQGFEDAVKNILTPKADGSYRYSEESRRLIVGIYNNRANRYYGWASSISIDGTVNAEEQGSFRNKRSEK